MRKLGFVLLLLASLATVAEPFVVHPGDDIQAALDRAARDPNRKHVRVLAGIYRPTKPAQAFIHFNHTHDGITLEAEGEVTLTAANEAIADRTAASFPAVVNHVVYFGDGISPRTVLRGFKITGANNFVTDLGGPAALEPRFEELRSTEGFYGHLFFFTDGGAIKIFGRSYPTLECLEIHDNYSAPCAGGISIEHRGFRTNSVHIADTIFRNNRALVTGPAVDLLPGSAAVLTNCLFVGNIANTGDTWTQVKGNIDWPEIPRLVATTLGYQPRYGSGALTVFPNSRVTVERCTFTANFNGADDRGDRSAYRNTLFWQNTATGGKRPPPRFELDIANATGVTNCALGGPLPDPRNTISETQNVLNCPDPQFDNAFTPRNDAFVNIGYRPVK